MGSGLDVVDLLTRYRVNTKNLVISGMDPRFSFIELLAIATRQTGRETHYVPSVQYETLPNIVLPTDPESCIYFACVHDPSGQRLQELAKGGWGFLDPFDTVHGIYQARDAPEGMPWMELLKKYGKIAAR